METPGEPPLRFIRLACKHVSHAVDWDGTFADLTRLFTDEFTSNETPKSLHLLDKGACRVAAARVYRLWDKEAHIAFEGFDLDAVKDGDTIQVNYECFNKLLDILEERRLALRCERIARQLSERQLTARARWRLKPPGGAYSGFVSGDSFSASGQKTGLSFMQRMHAMSAFMSEIGMKMVVGRKRGGAGSPSGPGGGDDGSWKSKLWRIMDEPSSGPAGAAVAVTILLLILYSTATFCMETLHPFYKPTLKTTDFWYVSEAVCIGQVPPDIARHVIDTHLNHRLLSHLASYHVASNACQAPALGYSPWRRRCGC